MTNASQHPSELQLSMYIDSALGAEEATWIDEHVESCPACRERLSATRDEALLIGAALATDHPEETSELVIPPYKRPATLRGFALANLVTGLVIWLAQFLWKTLFGELVVNATTWATSIYLPDIYAMASGFALYLIEEGTAMLDAYLSFVVASVLTCTTLWLVYIYRRSRAGVSMCLLVIAFGSMSVPSPASALDIRRDTDVITIPASETIDDTLVVAADTVLIQGTVTGDVIAVGRSINVSGAVGGNLVTFAESVTVSASVGGLALGAASTYELDAAVGGDLWVAGSQIDLESGAQIGRNATVASQRSTIEGVINKDLYAFGETVDVSGELRGDLEAFAARLRLLGEAHVTGDIRLRSGSEDALHRAETVRVDGEIEFLGMPKELVSRNPYATVEFYLWQAARLISAFLVGIALLWLVPGLGSVAMPTGIEGLKAAGIGFLAIISVPIVALLVALTLVGLPFTFIGLFAWALGIYLAKILIGVTVGRMLLSNRDSGAMPLLVGLALIIFVINIPIVGPILNFALTIVGLGLLVQYVVENIPAGERNTTS